ncbi:MAG: hypothetical protein AAF716_00520 [Cyanobacteria bacterium P01_D01_bin.1]
MATSSRQSAQGGQIKWPDQSDQLKAINLKQQISVRQGVAFKLGKAQKTQR